MWLSKAIKHIMMLTIFTVEQIASCELLAVWAPEHVSGAELQNFPLIAQLHSSDSRSPLRSRSGDLPLQLCSRSPWFVEPRSPLRSAHLTFWPTSLPLRFRSAARSDLRGEVRTPDLPTNRWGPPLHRWFFSFSQVGTCVILNFL